MQVRHATLADLPEVVEAGRKFYEETPFTDFIEFDQASVAEFAESAIKSETQCVLVAEKEGVVGIVVAITSPFFFNKHLTTGQEISWWVDPGERGHGAGQALHVALLTWLNDLGAHTNIMVALEGLKTEAVGRLYERQGYRKLEHTFIKRL